MKIEMIKIQIGQLKMITKDYQNLLNRLEEKSRKIQIKERFTSSKIPRIRWIK